MTPDTGRIPPLAASDPPSARRPIRPPSSEPGDRAIDALTAAQELVPTRTVVSHPPAPPRIAVLLTLILSIAAGWVATLLVPRLYQCRAVLAIAADATPAQIQHHRKELADYLVGSMPITADETAANETWRIDISKDQSLSVVITTNDPSRGASLAKQLAGDYCGTARDLAEQARESPGDAEIILAEYRDSLQKRLGQTRDKLDHALAALPSADPLDDHALRNRWSSLRSEFVSARQQLLDATQALESLRNAPEPSHGLVSAEKRREALDADAALREDLRELHVNLAEVKARLLEIGRQTRPMLGKLAAAASEMSRIRPERFGPPQVESTSGSWEVPANKFQTALTSFNQMWNSEFDALGSLEPDPMRAEILDLHERLRSGLNAFLFTAATDIATIREFVNALGDGQPDTARLHVANSEIIRAFHAAQAAFHRFEFAAGAIDGMENFRLDAALKGARGLRRRSQERIRRIDDRLQAQAAESAREQRLRDTTAADEMVEQVRAATDKTVEELVNLQDNLNAAAETSEEMYRATRELEIATHELQLTQADHDAAQRKLEGLAARRSESAAAAIHVVAAGPPIPINSRQRLQTGGIIAAITFVTLILGQLRVTRQLR